MLRDPASEPCARQVRKLLPRRAGSAAVRRRRASFQRALASAFFRTAAKADSITSLQLNSLWLRAGGSTWNSIAFVALAREFPHLRAQGYLNHLQIIDGTPQAIKFLLLTPGGGSRICELIFLMADALLQFGFALKPSLLFGNACCKLTGQSSGLLLQRFGLRLFAAALGDFRLQQRFQPVNVHLALTDLRIQ